MRTRNEYSSDEIFVRFHPKKGTDISIYYDPHNPHDLKPQMLQYYIVDDNDLIFLAVFMIIKIKTKLNN